MQVGGVQHFRDGDDVFWMIRSDPYGTVGAYGRFESKVRCDLFEQCMSWAQEAVYEQQQVSLMDAACIGTVEMR